MRVDLHFHFRRHKKDRVERLRNMVKKAEECGIRGVALLDHNYFPTDEDLGIARAAAPLITFWRACELDIRDEGRGVKNHVVVVSESGLPFPVVEGISTRDIGLLAEATSRGDVLTMLAHPFRGNHLHIAFDFNQFCPTLIDAVGRTANQEQLKRVVYLAAAWGMGLASASDSHETRHVGRHWMDFQEDAKTISDLTRMAHLSYYSLAAG